MPTNKRPPAPPAPAIKTKHVPNPILIPMEYKPTRYGNALNAKAVRSAEGLYPEIFFEDGERTLEMR